MTQQMTLDGQVLDQEPQLKVACSYPRCPVCYDEMIIADSPGATSLELKCVDCGHITQLRT